MAEEDKPYDADSFSDRLKQFIDYKGMSLNRFSNRVGFAQGGLSRVVSKQATFSVAKLTAIFREFPELSPRWLLLGEGHMIPGNVYQPGDWKKQFSNGVATEADYQRLVQENEALHNALLKQEGRIVGLLEALEALKKVKVTVPRPRGRPRKNGAGKAKQTP